LAATGRTGSVRQLPSGRDSEGALFPKTVDGDGVGNRQAIARDSLAIEIEPLRDKRAGPHPHEPTACGPCASGRQERAGRFSCLGGQSTSYDVLVPEIRNPPEHGAAIWVFEVPPPRRR
jgi:hypothetical protein